jgi:catechol 2,3-dioxygenase-like lactoylglutathione lyase family enzyme
MKRFHVHVSVGDLNRSIQFYTELFGSQPSVLKSDYARWMLDDPRGKSWSEDPQGVQWETFLTTGESTVYGHDPVRTEPLKTQEATCCAPNCCSPQAA